MTDNPIDILSPRLVEAIDLMSAGLSNKEIADQMHISESTVKHYLKKISDIVEPYHYTSRVALAVWWITHKNSIVEGSMKAAYYAGQDSIINNMGVGTKTFEEWQEEVKNRG